MRERVILFFKGMCMGGADVIPGVSGGTLALILGIYTEFVDSIRGLHLRWLPLLFRWLKNGRTEEDFAALRAEIETLNLGFLITLGMGIATAIVIGSKIIPTLMERFPVMMRAFFFGLILASVYVPYRMIRAQGGGAKAVASVALLAVLGGAFGFVVTNPGRSFQGATSWVTVESRGETLKDLTRRGPSSMTAEQVYWADKNSALREQIGKAQPEKAAALKASHEGQPEVLDKKVLKARAVPYDALNVPKGIKVEVPRPALWFIFVAGAVAICAMVLPGISGSYILLVFGAYFFILNALKGLLSSLVRGSIPAGHAMYIGVFIIAMVVGLLSFSRVLSFLLHRFTAPTLGLLVGLMLGCLRGIWPFQQLVNGVNTNVGPGAMSAEVPGALGAFVVGMGMVVVLTYVGQKTSAPDAEASGALLDENTEAIAE